MFTLSPRRSRLCCGGVLGWGGGAAVGGGGGEGGGCWRQCECFGLVSTGSMLSLDSLLPQLSSPSRPSTISLSSLPFPPPLSPSPPSYSTHP